MARYIASAVPLGGPLCLHGCSIRRAVCAPSTTGFSSASAPPILAQQLPLPSIRQWRWPAKALHFNAMAGCNNRHYNIQDNSFELFLLNDGEKKIEENVYSGMSNTSDFVINKEDHTLGNLLSEHLKLHPNVHMAGYKVAHPNVPRLFIRVQTDGTKTAREVFCAVCEKLINQLESLHQQFTREWELRRITNVGEQGNQEANGH